MATGYNIADYVDKLRAANTAYESTIDAIGDTFPGTWSLFCEDAGPAGGTRLDIGWAEDLSEVRIQRPGESKTFDGSRAYNATYELEVIYRANQLARTQVQYDPSGRIARMLQRFAQQAASMVDQRIWSVLDANTKTGPDGVALISASHPNGPSGTQSNSTSSALSHSTYRAGKAAMRSVLRENGEPYNLNPTHLFVHPDDEDVAREVTGADKPVAVDNTGAEATSGVVAVTSIANVYQGDTTVVVTPRITSGNWLLFDLSNPAVRPWMVAFGERPRPILPNTEDDFVVRRQDLYDYILQGDMIHGPLHWQAAYGNLSN